jgi:FixJ family two-component response regulator
MNENNPLVCVIDDESSIRESLSSLLRSVGLKVQAFSSAQEFLASASLEALSCLVLDVRLPARDDALLWKARQKEMCE